MELPEDVLAIIKVYSMPCTLPNWKTTGHMTYIRFYRGIHEKLIGPDPKKIKRFIRKVMHNNYLDIIRL